MTQHDLESFVTEVRQKTHANDHNGAVTSIANYVAHKHARLQGINTLQIACASLENLHKFYGHMPEQLNQVREDLRNRCYSFLSSDEQKAFHDAT